MNDKTDQMQIQRKNMIDSQLRPNKVNDKNILAAFADVEKEKFLPSAFQNIAYCDMVLELDDNRVVMEAQIIGRLLQALAIQKGDTALIIGDGVGYVSALIAKLANMVFVLEQQHASAKRCNENLINNDVINIALIEGDLCAGAPEHGPFDIIFINGAINMVPDALISQLSEGGRMVYIDGNANCQIGCAMMIKKDNQNIEAVNLFDCKAPKLPELTVEKGFQF